MCEQCSARTVTFGEVLPGWRLVRATRAGNMMQPGDWGLVQRDDPTYVWPARLAPVKNPACDLTDEQFDAMSDGEGELWNAAIWRMEAIERHWTGHPQSGYGLMSAAEDAGYDWHKDRVFAHWFVHQMALVVEANPTGDEETSERVTTERLAGWGMRWDDQEGYVKVNRGAL